MANEGNLEIGLKVNVGQATQAIAQVAKTAQTKLANASVNLGNMGQQSVSAAMLARNPGLAQMLAPKPPVIQPSRGGGGPGMGGGITRQFMSQLGLGGLVGMAPPIAAVTAQFILLRKVMQGVSSVLEHARSMYAKQLTSGGMPGGFIAHRSALAGVIGVSEDQVLGFGKAVEYLNTKLAWSSTIIAETTPNLTSVSWGFKVFKEDMKALGATLTNDFAPVLRQFSSGLSVIARGFTNLWKAIWDNPIARAVIKGKLSSTLFGVIASLGSSDGAAPNIDVNRKRFESSPWERMGLILGSGGINYAAVTAKNTGKIYSILDAMKDGTIPPLGVKMEDRDYPKP